MRVSHIPKKGKLKWYNAVGTLRYCPNSGWVVLDTPNSIVRYYANWVRKLTWKNGSMPMHGAHVTIVNGKVSDVRKSPYWAFRQGAKINFEYSNVIKTNDEYYWLPIRCERLKEIRQELGLTPFPKWEYHITCFFISR